MLPVIMFHHFHSDKHIVGQGSLSAEQFYDVIRKNNVISANEWYDRYKKGALKDEVCVSFDDNLKCQYDIAFPVLKDLGLKAFWFIYTSPLLNIVERLELYRYFRMSQFSDVDAFYKYFDDHLQTSEYAERANGLMKDNDLNKYLSEYSFYTYGDRKFRYIRDVVLSKEEYYELMDAMIAASGMDTSHMIDKLWMNRADIKDLHNDGQFIGLHSHTHPTKMELLPYNEQLNEYSTNKNILEDIIGKDGVFSISYPCNSYNKDTLEIMKELNVSIGFRANTQMQSKSSLEISRIDHTLLKYN
jgi:peptidoglycan/xylan/chitin deacetylase (PgdA/CDA1 family)